MQYIAVGAVLWSVLQSLLSPEMQCLACPSFLNNVIPEVLNPQVLERWSSLSRFQGLEEKCQVLLLCRLDYLVVLAFQKT